MNAEHYERLTELCQAAWTVGPGAPELAATRFCADDELRLEQEVESMLDADACAGSFLEAPSFEFVSSALASLPTSLSSGEVLGDFQIVERLGSGGMAEVFLAHDRTLGRSVALKVLPEAFAADSMWLQQLHDEARAASRLNHPNILTVYAFGNARGIHYLATELVEGPTLRDLMQAKALTPSEAIDITVQIASALEVAHAAGIVHRDIKPENLVRRSDGLVKILDFGLAERVGQKEGGNGVITGTPQYMSPEQAGGLSTDARTDLFSLGLVLYEMLHGSPAFRGSTVTGTLDQVRSRKPLPPTLNGSRCPRQLARIVARLLEKDRSLRFQTARDVRLELEAVRRTWKQARTGRKIAAIIVPALCIPVAFVIHRSCAAPFAEIHSLAVLPLEGRSNDDSRAYFNDGITGQLVSDLSTLKGLRVISPSSAMLFRSPRPSTREIARRLNVDALVSGSVTSAGKRVRISAQMIRASSQQTIWSESHECNVDDLPALQNQLTRTIAGQVQRNLRFDSRVADVQTRPVSADTRQTYYMGQYNANKGTVESYLKAIHFFEEAIVLDPSYAAAYSGLANAYVQLSSLAYHHFAPLEGMPKARVAALKAIELDDTLADPHVSLGFVKLTFDHDWPGAEIEIKRALALNPSSADAHVLMEWFLLACHRFPEARREIERALELDPLSLRMVSENQWFQTAIRDFRRAVDLGTRAIKTDSEFVPSLFVNALSYVELGDYTRAMAAAKETVHIQNVPSNVLLMAHVAARAGHRKWAERLLHQQITTKTSRYVCPYEVATAYVSLHRKQDAFTWLKRAVDDRVDCTIFLPMEPWMDRLRQDPEYKQLIAEIKVPSN